MHSEQWVKERYEDIIKKLVLIKYQGHSDSLRSTMAYATVLALGQVLEHDSGYTDKMIKNEYIKMKKGN